MKVGGAGHGAELRIELAVGARQSRETQDRKAKDDAMISGESNVHFPTKVREEVVFEQGCAQIWADEDLNEFEKHGDCARGGGRSELRIPQHHAYTVEQALQFINRYRQLAERFRWEFVLRGQTRDYYHEASGRLLELPSIMRPHNLDFYTDCVYYTREYRQAAEPWMQVLEDLGVETSAARGQIHHPVAAGRLNPVTPAILQHYGFPTDHLDVTTDPLVALWFALHATKSDRKGRIHHNPLPARSALRRRKHPRAQDAAAVPSVHVIIQPPFRAEELHQPFPLVHLAALDALTRVAKRPMLQSAVSLPCTTARVSEVLSLDVPPIGVGTVYRWPAAILKLYFPFKDTGRSDMTAEALFPKDEPLYQRLFEVKAPHLAIYA